MKNKQINFWLCNVNFFLNPKYLKTYFSLKKNFEQEKFENYANTYALKVFKAINIDYSIYGKENLIQGPCLYIFNHNSMFDSYFSYPIATRHSYFIAHEFEYALNVPLVGNFLKWVNSIFVNRSSLRAGLKSIKEGKQQLEKGNNLCIFAEGELTHLIKENEDDIVGPFHSGSFKAAKEVKVPVIPVAIKGSEKIHTSSSILGKIHSGKVTVHIGNPIYDFINNDEITTKEVAQKTRKEIIKLLK